MNVTMGQLKDVRHWTPGEIQAWYHRQGITANTVVTWARYKHHKKDLQPEGKDKVLQRDMPVQGQVIDATPTPVRGAQLTLRVWCICYVTRGHLVKSQVTSGHITDAFPLTTTQSENNGEKLLVPPRQCFFFLFTKSSSWILACYTVLALPKSAILGKKRMVSGSFMPRTWHCFNTLHSRCILWSS